MLRIDNQIVENLYLEAKHNPRKRSHYLLHKSHQDKVQRLLIGFVKGSFVEPHFHELPHQWESFFVLDGSLRLTILDENNNIKSTEVIGLGTSVFAIEIQPNEIHSLECLSEKALLLEIKEGPFDPSFAKKLI
ncbi:cupin fold WbuC family metalloprotein [Providencia alcalifaciens]|jgi:cupin fold WbuC family metalloprotein|uniref:Cupin fold WbuC family metalloprotein n=1 Tax=Providencia alcalifaciens TaxID=126385 RepID=A0A4R3NGI6_9GAMM|nr:WbuC family cupin fold metalloprotein [Providencia alcalifaciens]MDR2277397.1 WbuC family cupin fold metalloprotein [Vagococcus sp.]MDR3039328.1 WbuC family cupin fold metalloprotein [Acinetobacter pittii]TCT30359.1 cupin fold WbuC family metalloprotein [Providencia alcalifaciens]